MKAKDYTEFHCLVEQFEREMSLKEICTQEGVDYRGYISWLKRNGFSRMRLVHCIVHIRREWEKALSESRKGASWFLAKIRELYHIEHECDRAGMAYEERRLERQARSRR